MEIWDLLLQGFATAGTPVNLLWAFVGCALGTAVGVLPGIGPATAVAMLLPITTQVEATASMIFFAGIYYGAMYGGSTTSILLNTPGETATMVTAMEGNKMAKSGRAGAALATSAIGSFVAGSIATVLVTLFAPVVADFAVKLGPPGNRYPRGETTVMTYQYHDSRPRLQNSAMIPQPYQLWFVRAQVVRSISPMFHGCLRHLRLRQ
jgi:putative tricarboxylic transport membrane protein